MQCERGRLGAKLPNVTKRPPSRCTRAVRNQALARYKSPQPREARQAQPKTRLVKATRTTSLLVLRDVADVQQGKGNTMEAMNNWLAEIGRRVRSLRAQRGVSRKHLSNHSEISERYLAQVESGQANLSFAMFYKISRALDVNLLDLIDLDRHGPEDAELHALINRMDEDQKHKLLAHVQTVVGTARRETAERFALLGCAVQASQPSAGCRRAARYAVYPHQRPHCRIGGHVTGRDHGPRRSKRLPPLGVRGTQRHRAKQHAVHHRNRRQSRRRSADVHHVAGALHLVWVQAQPEQHMNRVMQQGDMRPFDRHQQSLDDLKLMLQERETFYSQADHQIDTSTVTAESATDRLCGIIESHAP